MSRTHACAAGLGGELLSLAGLPALFHFPCGAGLRAEGLAGREPDLSSVSDQL